MIQELSSGTVCALLPDMDPAHASAAATPVVTFQDGLGERHHVLDRAKNEPLEVLCLRGELTAVPAFEFALRERVSHLSTFRHACYGRVKSVERLRNASSTLALVSETTPGVRLSEILAYAERSEVTLDIDAALCLLRRLMPAVAMLHENAPEIAHGAIAPERIVVTPTSRIVVVEHVLGSAISELKYPPERYWRELRVAVPGSTPQARFDQRSDVAQIAVVALSLILGRRLLDEETPNRLGDVVASSWANSARGGLEPLPAGLRAWLMRALQLDPRSRFDSASDAQDELEDFLGESDYLAAPTTLDAFLAEFRAANEPAARARAAAAPPVSEPVPAPISSPPATSPAVAYEAVEAKRTAAPIYARSMTRPIEPLRPIEPPTRTSDTGTAPGSGTHAYPPVAASPSSEFRRSVTTSAEPEAARAPEPAVVQSPRHFDMPAAPTPVMQAFRASDRASDPVDVGISPIARDDEEPIAPMCEPYTTPKEISFEDVDHEGMGMNAQKPAVSRKKTQMTAAAIGVLVLAGAGVPAYRYLLAPAAAPVEGTLNMTTNPPGAQLFIDGVERGVTPVTVALKPGPHSLELRGNGAPRLLPVTINAGAQVSQYIELPTSAATSGELRVRTEPAGARITVDGVARGVSPVTVADLPPGDHAVLLESDLGTIKQTVAIEAGNTASLTVPMAAPEGAPVSGWVAVSSPTVVQMFEGGRLLGSSQSDRLMVSAGRHEIELVADQLGYHVTRTVQVSPGKVTPIKLELPKGTIALNATPWAEVWVDGDKIGDTPIGNYQLTLGPHDFVFRHPDLGEQRHTAVVTLKTPARLSVDMRKN
jgi:serine/threonine protein kinase